MYIIMITLEAKTIKRYTQKNDLNSIEYNSTTAMKKEFTENV